MIRELLINRKPLQEREQPINSDVADAIEFLVERDTRLGNGLPTAFTKADIVIKLIEIAHTDDDGTLLPITPIARRTMTDAFVNRLTNSNVFQAGYKHYEERSRNPVVPVTDFFLKNVYGNGNVADCLDAMSAFEIMQSLPKRRTRMRSNADGDYVRNEDGEVLQSGEIAGIVVFPPNSHAELQRAWLMRLAGATAGQLDKTIERIEHARPEGAAMVALREDIARLKPAIHKALPRPKKRPASPSEAQE